MEDFLRKFVGTIFLFATILSGVALIVVMLNFNKINPGAPTKAKAAVHKAEEAKEGKETEALKEGEVSEEGKELEKTEEGVGAEGQMVEPAEDVEK